MAAIRTLELNERLHRLRDGAPVKEFARRYFGVPKRTYTRYESTPDEKLPGAVLMLMRLYYRHGLSLRDK